MLGLWQYFWNWVAGPAPEFLAFFFIEAIDEFRVEESVDDYAVIEAPDEFVLEEVEEAT